VTQMPSFPGNCAWCGEPASERVHVRGRGMRRVYALACSEHARRFVPHVPSKPRREPAVLERTEPLCESCGAEITWVTLVKAEAGRYVPGKRMPVDRRPMHGKEPKRSLVVVSPKTSRALVLTDAIVRSGEAQRWLDAGARLHLSHFTTCSSAARHRRQRTAAAAA
jgi:hypothetical protein